METCGISICTVDWKAYHGGGNARFTLPTMIYAYQQPTFSKLVRTVAAYKRARECSMGVKPRFHRLLIGATGTGKSYLAGKVGRDLNWQVFEINMASWIVLGARQTPTWENLVVWLCNNAGLPKIIVLDEIDKINGSDSWTRYLRAEIFDLLDGKVTQQTEKEDYDLSVAAKSLNETLIFGCGAFQDAFEASPSLGFKSEPNKPLTSNDISKHLPRELVNRFDSELLILPELTRKDYEKMLEDVRPNVPSAVYDHIEAMGAQQIELALDNKTSARFIENLVAQAFYTLSATDVTSPVPAKEPEPEPEPEFDPWELSGEELEPEQAEDVDTCERMSLLEKIGLQKS